jgi:DNA/RNA-binding domain of Phe-tRNA-synthetase-like protein
MYKVWDSIQVATIKLSDTPYIVLPESVGRQLHWRDGQQVRITSNEQGLVLVLDVVDDFEQVLDAYQSTGDEELADALLDMLDGCLGEATPDEYDLNLKWGRCYQGR